MTKVSLLLLSAVLVTAEMGCQSKPFEKQQPGASSTLPAQVGSAPIPEDPHACRAPMEPECNPCCEPQADGFCIVRSWSSGPLTDPELSEVTPWYNATVLQKEACSSQCKPCARCTQRDASELQRLGTRPECDCTQPPSIDPCMTPGECGCYCSSLIRLTQACPELAPKRNAPSETRAP